MFEFVAYVKLLGVKCKCKCECLFESLESLPNKCWAVNNRKKDKKEGDMTGKTFKEYAK